LKRSVVPELLDSDSGTPEEIADSLADLRWFNRYFGGHSTTSALLDALLRSLPMISRLTYLDVACASADNIQAFKRKHPSIDFDITVLDRSPTHLPRGGVRAVCGDALTLPFHKQSFDVVGCSLFIHHLEPAQILAFAQESLRVARHAVLINDLVRSPVHYAFALAGLPLYRSRLTRHDAPVSVRRAYTPSELSGILKPCGAARIEVTRHYFYRMGLILWR
jgi:SAM-dependent methyltransferase